MIEMLYLKQDPLVSFKIPNQDFKDIVVFVPSNTIKKAEIWTKVQSKFKNSIYLTIKILQSPKL